MLGRFVTQAVELLENEDLEHEDGIERRTSSFAPIFGIVSGDFFEDWTKALPVDDVAELENTDDAAGHSFLMVQRRKKIPTTIDLAIRLHLQIFVELTRLRNLKEPGSYRRCSPEQIVKKLRAASDELGRGKELGEVCRQLAVSEATYHRWKKQYDGAQMETVKRLKELEKENSRLKKLVAEQALDMDMLKEINAKKW